MESVVKRAQVSSKSNLTESKKFRTTRSPTATLRRPVLVAAAAVVVVVVVVAVHRLFAAME
jgi:hypothetical protein